MALSEFETKRIHKILGHYIDKNRPPENIREEVDLSFRVTGQSVEIFEIRPIWNNPKEKNRRASSKSYICKESKFMEGILATSRFKMASV